LGFGVCPSFKGQFSVAPCQTLALRFATFCIAGEQRLLFLGAGEAGVGIAELVSYYSC
jgi:hypothetical protein